MRIPCGQTRNIATHNVRSTNQLFGSVRSGAADLNLLPVDQQRLSHESKGQGGFPRSWLASTLKKADVHVCRYVKMHQKQRLTSEAV